MGVDKNGTFLIDNIQELIFTIRGVQVMLDSYLAKMYGVETKNLNLAVKRNIERFPEKFRFQLNQEEFDESENSLRLQIETSKNNSLRLQNETLKEKRGGRRYLPYVFTEQGVAMLSSVLRSETAIKVSIQIIDAFVEMRKFISQNGSIFQRISNVEQKQIISDIKQKGTDNKIDVILDALEEKEIKPKQGVFYDGQIFDAYKFISNIIRLAKQSIILIDNYVDDTTLQLFTKRKPGVAVIIYTKKISKVLKQDLKKFNEQYEKIKICKLYTSHDRFMLIDKKVVYHFGASLKDLGKKWFAFSKLEIDAGDIIEKLDFKG